MPSPSRLAVLSALCAATMAVNALAQVRVVNPAQAQEGQDSQNMSRFEPIHVAAMKGDALTVQQELDKGVEIDLRIQGGIFAGATALMLAGRDADDATMRYLMDRGADPRAVDDRRISVLMWASSTEGSAAKIRAVLERGVEVNLRSQDGSTALHWAAGLGRDPEMVKALIDAGALIDLADNRGRTPLMTASRVGNAGAVRHLLAAGAERSRRSPQGLNALHWAVEGRTANGDTVRALVEAGMSVETQAADGSTPLLIAAINGREQPVIALLELGARNDASNNFGLTPLMAASAAPSPEVVKRLLDAGAPVNTRDSNGRTALHYATSKGSGIITAMLLRRGADPDITDNDGWRPIHMARTMATLDPIVRAGADIEAPCKVSQYNNWTPLMLVVGTGNQFLVRRLLNAGADPVAGTDQGLTPTRIAMSFNPEVGAPLAEMLRESIAQRQKAVENAESDELRRRREQDAAGPRPD